MQHNQLLVLDRHYQDDHDPPDDHDHRVHHHDHSVDDVQHHHDHNLDEHVLLDDNHDHHHDHHLVHHHDHVDTELPRSIRPADHAHRNVGDVLRQPRAAQPHTARRPAGHGHPIAYQPISCPSGGRKS